MDWVDARDLKETSEILLTAVLPIRVYSKLQIIGLSMALKMHKRAQKTLQYLDMNTHKYMSLHYYEYLCWRNVCQKK